VDDYSKRLDPGSATPEGTPSARDDTVFRSGVFCFGVGLPFLKDWITALSTPPNRYALWRGPRQAVMTQYIVWWDLFWAASTINTSPRHHVSTTSGHHESLSGEPFHHFTFPRFYRSTYLLWGGGSHLHHPPRTGSSWGQPYNL